MSHKSIGLWVYGFAAGVFMQLLVDRIATTDWMPAIFIKQAIQHCETELPRHLSCVPVYGAKVSDEPPTNREDR